MLTSAWQTLTFSGIPLTEWYRRSFLFRVLGYFSAWREGSWLLQWSDGIGAVLISLVLMLAPFVPNSLTAIFLMAVAAFWGLLTFTTPVGQGITPTQLLITLYWGIATIATVFSPVPTAALTGLLKLTLYILFFCPSDADFASSHLAQSGDDRLLAHGYGGECLRDSSGLFRSPFPGHLGGSHLSPGGHHTGLQLSGKSQPTGGIFNSGGVF